MKKILLITIILILAGTAVFADPETSEIILEDDIIDLRGADARPSRNEAGDDVGEVSTMDELEVGSIFLSVDNHARKVVDIYEHNGRTVIETVEPLPEEVFVALYVPSFEVSLGRENIISTSIADGVTILDEGADRGDMLSSDFSVPADENRSVTWLETDLANDGKDILTVNVDMVLASTEPTNAMLEKLEEYEEAARENDENSDSEGDDSESSNSEGDDESGTETDVSVNGEIGLVGTIRLVEPTFSGGIKKPKLKFSWVSKWWGGYFTIEHVSGYIRGGVEAAHQLDMKLTGTVSLSAEMKIPVYAVMYKKDGVEATIGLYIKIGVDGSISMSVEFSEYSWEEVGATCKLAWPFIPYKVIGECDNYNNFAYRPIVSAEAEAKAGLYLGADLEVLGIGLFEAEAGGGVYIWASGYIEPMGIMGYDSEIGSYGSFEDWIIKVEAEAGIYGEIGAEILTVDLDIWEQKWPFWEWSMDWVL